MEKKRSGKVKLVCFFLLFNCAYLVFMLNESTFAQVISRSGIPALAKIWLGSLLSIFSLGQLGHQNFVIALLLWNLITIIGLLLLKSWSRRSLIYILMFMIAGGIIVQRQIPDAVNSMRIYMQRGYWAYIHNTYALPVKVICEGGFQCSQWTITKLKPPYPGKPCKQYEPFMYFYDFDIGESTIPKTEGLKEDDHYYDLIYGMSTFSFRAASLIASVAIFLFRILLLVWLVAIPSWLLYYLTRPKVKEQFKKIQ